MKKLTSILLSLVVVLGVLCAMPFAANAYYDDSDEDDDYGNYQDKDFGYDLLNGSEAIILSYFGSKKRLTFQQN